MVAELHAGDGAAGLCAVEARWCKKTVRVGERATIGKAAAFGGGNGGGSSSPRLVLREPVARHVGARDRRDQQLRIGGLRRRNDPLDRTGLGDMRAVEHEDRVAHLIRGGEIVSDIEDRDAVLVGEPAQRAEDRCAQ